MLVTDIITDYIKYMEAKLVFYENQSQKLLPGNIPQILLIHANILNSDCPVHWPRCTSGTGMNLFPEKALPRIRRIKPG